MKRHIQMMVLSVLMIGLASSTASADATRQTRLIDGESTPAGMTSSQLVSNQVQAANGIKRKNELNAQIAGMPAAADEGVRKIGEMRRIIYLDPEDGLVKERLEFAPIQAPSGEQEASNGYPFIIHPDQVDEPSPLPLGGEAPIGPPGTVDIFSETINPFGTTGDIKPSDTNQDASQRFIKSVRSVSGSTNDVANLNEIGEVNTSDINRARSIGDFFKDTNQGLTTAEKKALVASLTHMVQSIRKASGSDNLVADLNGDGHVNTSDISIARNMLSIVEQKKPTDRQAGPAPPIRILNSRERSMETKETVEEKILRQKRKLRNSR